ncbi:MAG: HAD-IIB family hydrolase [Pseudomonadota bacterium]
MNSLLVCTDLDRTLIPNGPQRESPLARRRFAALASRAEVSLAYVTGRHRDLVEKAMADYSLPIPDFVIGDVGTTIYRVGPSHAWEARLDWQEHIGADWAGISPASLAQLFNGLAALRLQEKAKQNRFKLSYYVPLQENPDLLLEAMRSRLDQRGVKARLIWSVDETEGVGLLDVLPAGASKYHAIEFLMRHEGFGLADTVFAGDSGNDLEVLASPIPAVLVANSQRQVRDQARFLAESSGNSECLYMADGGFLGMNGNYSAGILEGIAHYHPQAEAWMRLNQQ